MSIRDQIFSRSALHSTPNGRDYILLPNGEILSINGLYCDELGNPTRYGEHVKLIDIRWAVVKWADVYVSNEDHTEWKTKQQLLFVGDNKDREVMKHYGYRIEYDAKQGYHNVVKDTPKGESRCR